MAVWLTARVLGLVYGETRLNIRLHIRLKRSAENCGGHLRVRCETQFLVVCECLVVVEHCSDGRTSNVVIGGFNGDGCPESLFFTEIIDPFFVH